MYNIQTLRVCHAKAGIIQVLHLSIVDLSSDQVNEYLWIGFTIDNKRE